MKKKYMYLPTIDGKPAFMSQKNLSVADDFQQLCFATPVDTCKIYRSRQTMHNLIKKSLENRKKVGFKTQFKYGYVKIDISNL